MLATILFAPLISLVMGKSLIHTSTMTLMLSSVAMVWNMVYNALFERVERSMGLKRTVFVRVVHACLFEGGLIFVLVPIIAWWLDISLLEAFLLDIGLLILFLPYTMAFNWVYDVWRERLIKREAASDKIPSEDAV
ncbi:Chlorhexidine efflux transporter [compost metagenome]